MAYAKKTWALDDPITDVALNNIETGVDIAHDVLDATGTPTGLSAATTNAIGTATAKAKADHTHAILANGAPSTQAMGDAAVVGTSAALARADHKHAMPAFGTSATDVLQGTAVVSGTTAWTTIPATTVVEIDVTFPRTMPSVPRVVISPASPTGAIYEYVLQGAVEINSITTSGFTIRARIYPNGVAGYGGFNWIATSA